MQCDLFQSIPNDCKQCGQIPTLLPYTVSEYNITDLIPYTNYTVQMYIINPGGCGMVSDVLDVQTHQDCECNPNEMITNCDDSSKYLTASLV